MNTKEELNTLKEEIETLNKKLHELTEEELAQVSGGSFVSLGDLVSEPPVRESTVIPFHEQLSLSKRPAL